MSPILKLLALVLFVFAAPGEIFSAEPAPQVECRKLSSDVECPLDYLMVSSAIPFFDVWRSFGVTANHLTLIGGVIQTLACFFLWRRYTFLAGVLWLFGYYFDAIDGSYARYHHLCSPYGDLLDHLRDWICAAMMLVVLYFRYSLKLFDYLFLAMTFLLATIYMGAQEQYLISLKPHIQTSEILTVVASLISFFNLQLEETIHWLRWVGAAHMNLAVAIYLAVLPLTRTKMEEFSTQNLVS